MGDKKTSFFNRCWQFTRKTYRDSIKISNMAPKKLEKNHVTVTYVGHLVSVTTGGVLAKYWFTA